MSSKIDLTLKKKEELRNSVIPIAQEFRIKYLESNLPIKDTFKTLEGLGYFIVRFPADDDLSGFHIEKSGYNCIFINSSHSLGRQYFSLWHECYHAYTGDGGGISLFNEIQHSETEYKAECFASEILLPKDLVKEYVKKHLPQNLKFVSYKELITMQNYFRVSYSALITRLRILYPEFKKDLAERYLLGKKHNAAKLMQKTLDCEGDAALISSTNDIYIPQRFYEMLQKNLSNDRITSEKVNSILELLDKVRSTYDTNS